MNWQRIPERDTALRQMNECYGHYTPQSVEDVLFKTAVLGIAVALMITACFVIGWLIDYVF